MKILIKIIGLGMLFFFTGCMKKQPPVLKCSCEEELKDTIKQMFDADSVLLYSKRLREEPYFPEIRAITVCIINGTTNTLDFKTLPIKYQGFDNYSQIEDGLKKEAEIIAHLLFEKCDTEKFNDIIIMFFKYDSDGKPYYQFICHYDYELFPEKWSKYLPND